MIYETKGEDITKIIDGIVISIPKEIAGIKEIDDALMKNYKELMKNCKEDVKIFFLKNVYRIYNEGLKFVGIRQVLKHDKGNRNKERLRISVGLPLKIAGLIRDIRRNYRFYAEVRGYDIVISENNEGYPVTVYKRRNRIELIDCCIFKILKLKPKDFVIVKAKTNEMIITPFYIEAGRLNYVLKNIEKVYGGVFNDRGNIFNVNNIFENSKY